MLDILFNARRAQRHPVELIFVGIFYSSISVLLGSWVFSDYSRSIAIVFLTVLSCLYVVQGAIREEQKKQKNYVEETWLLKEHKGTVLLILFLFIGFTVSFSLWSLFLESSTSDSVFRLQKDSVNQIRMITGNATLETFLFKIFSNNLKIVLISLVFALVYGAGAIYILVWNASVMGYVIGSIAKTNSGIFSIPLLLFKYFLHGVPEMLAYIIAAFAGGLLYFSFIKGDILKTERSRSIVVDIVILLFLAIVLLLIAAIIEVYISSYI